MCPHNHPSDQLDIERLKVLQKIRERVLSSDGNLKDIMHDMLAKVPEEVKVLLPTKDAMLQKMKRLKKKSHEWCQGRRYHKTYEATWISRPLKKDTM